jgi:hypothetical protein
LITTIIFYCQYRFPWGLAVKGIRINLVVEEQLRKQQLLGGCQPSRKLFFLAAINPQANYFPWRSYYFLGTLAS